MSDTLDLEEGRTIGTRIVLDVAHYMERTTALGAKTREERRQIAGLSRPTEHRWLKGKSVPNWRRARMVADRLQTTEDRLFVEVAS